MKFIKKLFILPTLMCLPTISLFSCNKEKNVELEPQACFLKEDILWWHGEGTTKVQLHPIIYPEGCHPKLIWETSDPNNLCVTDNGLTFFRGSHPATYYDETVSVYPQGHKELTASVHVINFTSFPEPFFPPFRQEMVFNADDDIYFSSKYWGFIGASCFDLKRGLMSQLDFFRLIRIKKDDGNLYIPKSLRDYIGLKRKILVNGIYQEVEVIGVNEDYQRNGSDPIFTFQFTHPVCDSESEPIKVKWDQNGCKDYWSSNIRTFLNNELFSSIDGSDYFTPVTRKAITYQDGHWGATEDTDLSEEEIEGNKIEKLFLPALTDIYNYDELNIFYKDENMRYNPELEYTDRQYTVYKKNVGDSKREDANTSLIRTDLEGNPVSYWLASPSAFEFKENDKLVNVITKEGINDYSNYNCDQELYILPCFCI